LLTKGGNDGGVQVTRGEKIYECDLNITGVTDYGVTLDAVLSGKGKVPLQGTRFDVAFEGDSKGRLTGKLRGVEYLLMRADGRTDLSAAIRAARGANPRRLAAHLMTTRQPQIFSTSLATVTSPSAI
jgi:hypothetical protein